MIESTFKQHLKVSFASAIALLALLTHTPRTNAQNSASVPTKEVNVLDDMIEKISTTKSTSTDQALELNQSNQSIIEASTSSDASLDRARLQVNTANLDAIATQNEAATHANSSERDESWSSTISDSVTKGVDSGAATLGGAIGGGLNASSLKKNGTD